ncbi:hypothetical protein SO802_013782 [Lithocarpus litseifolius]|uniref:Reverse transcriptase zinc-binding domain-containing protein n=1 Tax=Lithocarpus litseifolius TaxID=425828 RepID=A0AAW2D786_9ROSI
MITHLVDDDPDSHAVKIGKYLLTNGTTSQLLIPESGECDLRSDKGELYVSEEGSVSPEDTLVGELIDHEKVRWKAEVLAALFLPYEVDIIQSIPLSSHLPEDKLVWAETSNGKFNVCSAYTVATRLSSNPNSGTSSDMGQGRQFWKRLWALPLPHKTRHFAWRACRDILPTKANLQKCKVVQDSLCDGCRLEVETTSHIFISYPRAREVWACSKIVLPGGAFSMNSFYDLMWKMVMVDHIDVDMVARVVILAWAMWYHRNEDWEPRESQVTCFVVGQHPIWRNIVLLQ